MIKFSKIPTTHVNGKRVPGFAYMYLSYNTRKEHRFYIVNFFHTDYNKEWNILPALACKHDPTMMKSPSFTLELKWLCFKLLTLSTSSNPPGTED